MGAGGAGAAGEGTGARSAVLWGEPGVFWGGSRGCSRCALGKAVGMHGRGWGGARHCGRVGPRAGRRVPALQEGTHWEQTGTSTGRRWGQRWRWAPRGGAGPSEGSYRAARGWGPCPRALQQGPGWGTPGICGFCGGGGPACSWGVRGACGAPPPPPPLSSALCRGTQAVAGSGWGVCTPSPSFLLTAAAPQAGR